MSKLKWMKHSCGGLVAIIPKELGGLSGDRSSVQLVPNAFGSTKTRIRLRNHALEQHFFHRQFYSSMGEAKRALMAALKKDAP